MCDTRDGINNSAHGFPGRGTSSDPRSINLTDSLIKPSISSPPERCGLRVSVLRWRQRQTTPLLTRSRGFNGSIQCQNIVWKAILLMTAVISEIFFELVR